MEDTSQTVRGHVAICDVAGKRPRRPVFVVGRRLIAVCFIMAFAGSQSGCSLFVMAGKMFFGDPKQTCSFSAETHVDLVEDQKTVLVVCSTPEDIKTDFPSLNFDLLEGVTRRIKRQEIKIVNPNEVADWMDDHLGSWDKISDFAEQFDADYIIHIDLEHFSYKEENSPALYRGRVQGTVHAYEVKKIDGQKQVLPVFVQEYTSEYPKLYPVSSSQLSAKMFIKRYLDEVSTELAQMFYNYRVSERIR